MAHCQLLRCRCILFNTRPETYHRVTGKLLSVSHTTKKKLPIGTQMEWARVTRDFSVAKKTQKTRWKIHNHPERWLERKNNPTETDQHHCTSRFPFPPRTPTCLMSLKGWIFPSNYRSHTPTSHAPLAPLLRTDDETKSTLTKNLMTFLASSPFEMTCSSWKVKWYGW